MTQGLIPKKSENILVFRKEHFLFFFFTLVIRIGWAFSQAEQARDFFSILRL